jgi:predicted metal-dependent TIM-barrel fold hydrolase
MTSRTTDDYTAMAKAGIMAVLEPAFWLGQPRTTAGAFVDYFNSLIGWERFRASQFGIRHFCAISLNPKEANNPKLAREVLGVLPRYLDKDGVVAVGEIGFDDQTDIEEEIFAAQLKLALEHELPVLVHTPHRDKKKGTIRSIDLVRSLGFPEEKVLIDHNNEETLPIVLETGCWAAHSIDHNNEETLPIVLETGCWAAHSIYPNTKMDEARMATLVKKYGTDRILINSAADWGVSDPLKVPKTVVVMREMGIPEVDITRIVWGNPATFFSQSGKLELDDIEVRPSINQTKRFSGNTVLRGQSPVVER